MKNIPTPHIEATSIDEIAKVVLMPGDPLRAKMVAETYLQDARLFNQVRGMLGYTGLFKGSRVSVMGSGMGFGSIGIYSYELYRFYDVETIIRIGSCGGFHPDLNLMDIILTDHAYSTETFAREAHGITDALIPGSQRIAAIIRKVAAEHKIKLFEGNIASGNIFYSTIERHRTNKAIEQRVIGREMESFALFANALALKKEAACLLTVSEAIGKHGQNLSAEMRQNGFNDMVRLGLDAAIASQR
jgi:purine-nucleoside phosphorylase